MRVVLVFAVLFLLRVSAAAQPLWPGATYDPAIPALKSVLGHDAGEEITSPEGIATYLRALAAAAPDRTRLIEYARTWENRPLYVLAVGSRERLAKLDDIKAGLKKIADPRGLAAADADALVRDLPVVVWLLHAVHGNEISSSDAALAEAYHLLAARGDATVDLILREAIVLIDPLENPDGRARFVSTTLQGRAARPDPEPFAAEHDEPWPGGRTNHYLFDMNRDWFSQSQPETRGRTKLYLEFFPQVVVDLHEMGGNSTYYFAPPAEPLNPHITKDQAKWFETFGRANAQRFDERGFAYFIREVYDSFYPGYGESWPIFHGAIGMTYEQASARGLVFRRTDDTLLTYRDGVLHHFTAAITTAATAARNREAILRDYLNYRRSASEVAGPREYLLAPGQDPSRAERLARLLARQGIDVRRASEPIKLSSRPSTGSGRPEPAEGRTLPAGTFVVSAAQPAGRLIRNLLDPHTGMDEKFIKEQERRRKARLSDQIYDVTAWSLPLAFDVEVVTSDRPTGVKTSAVAAEPESAPVKLPPAKVGYLIPWGSAAAATVAEALKEGLKVQSAGKPFTMAGRRYDAGTAIVRTPAHGPDLAERLGAIAGRHGAEVVAIDTAWVDEGISLGSGEVATLLPPRVLLAWDAPASSLSAGWARYVLERRFAQPVTAVRTSTLQNVNMSRYNVLVLPSGTYSLNEDALRRLKDWLRAGGTLITIGEASRWAARERNGLLETRTLLRDGTPEMEERPDERPSGGSGGAAKPGEQKEFVYEKAIQPERERPESTPGAMLRVKLDPEHWLAVGHDDEIQAIVESQRVFAPIKLDKGRNVGVYAAKDRLVASGLAWEEARGLLAQRAYLIHQPFGQGHIVAFAEDPNYRAFTEATELLFINAVLLAPGR